MQHSPMATSSNPVAGPGTTSTVSSPTAAEIEPWRLAPLLNNASLVLAVSFLALHFVHLSADFPNFSRWMDWSKYTDEGWYGDAAIRHFQLGHWYVPGDFNPAVALPVWPLLEGLLFAFTGVSLIAARALTVCVFAGILLASWSLVRRSEPTVSSSPPGTSIAASLAVLLLATNPFCFVFTRLAILEPLLVLLTMVALLTARRASAFSPGPRASSVNSLRLNRNVILGLGLLLSMIILTKTTGLFLVPAIAWMLFASLGYRMRLFAQVGGSVAGVAFVLWATYFLFCVRPHYLLDYQYLFSANAYTKITRATFFSVLASTFKDAKWFGAPLFACAIASVVLAALSWRRLLRCPLIPTLLLWAFGYTAFLAYHDNLQPRYYLVVAIPLTLLVPVAFRDLVHPHLQSRFLARAIYLLATLVLACIILPDASQTLSIVRHPQYTFLSAAHQIHDYIAADGRKHPLHSQLVLSISGSDLSLMTGLHGICDDFGTSELTDRVKQYKPGWYAAWDLIEDDKMDALSPQFHVTRVATYPAMDDPDRNLLVLYRLEPRGQEEEQPLRRHARLARNRVGQQPSTTQLKH